MKKESNPPPPEGVKRPPPPPAPPSKRVSGHERVVSCDFQTGDIVRVREETYHGKPVGMLAEVLGVNEIGWPRIMYNQRNIETLPPSFLVLICQAKLRSN